MPRKHQKPLGVVPIGGFAALPKLPREAVDSLSEKYGLQAENLFALLGGLAAEWRMDVSVYSAATNPNVARAFSHLIKSAEQLERAWEYIEYNIDEGMASVQGAILQTALVNGLVNVREFQRWLSFLSELSPRQIGRKTASSRDKHVVPLRRLLGFLSAYWMQEKGVKAAAYWSDYEAAMRTNEGGEFVRDAAEVRGAKGRALRRGLSRA